MTDDPNRPARLDDIWDAAMACPPADRAHFLRSACGDDHALWQALEAALVNVSRAEAFLEQPIAAVAAHVLDVSIDPVLTGERLNALVIGPLIGAGGMGHVYRAHDTELDRDVAIKVLAPEFAGDADRLRRLEHEARVLASLNHPNIAHIHGLESCGPVTAIVMELVEGETLADRVVHGPIDVAAALPIARQIIEALEAAHERGVVHRDLKPANIQVSLDGRVKVLDFGLATTAHQVRPDGHDTRSAGVVSPRPSMVLGTAAYMAPEQARRQAVDRRADMWALGCVVFEMLTGQAAFAGATRSEVLSRVVQGNPDWESLPTSTPPAVRRLLRRCLEKDVRHRLDSAAVARLEIDEATTELSPVPPSAVTGTRRWFARPPARWALVGGAAVVLAPILVQWTRPSRQPRPLIVSSFAVDQLVLGQPGVHLALAPTGRTILYAAGAASGRVLWRRDLDRLDPEPLIDTRGGSDVFFSDDGQRIGFEVGSELWWTSLEGGTPRRLQSNFALRGGTWGAGDRIVVGRVGSGLWLTSVTGTESRQLTFPPDGERHELPQLLPGGRGVLFTVLAAHQPPHAAILLLDTGQTRMLFEGAGARYVSSGHVMFGRHDKLWSVAFDVRSFQTRGTARAVRDDVLWSVLGYPQFAVNGDALAYVRSNQDAADFGKSLLTLVNRQGVAEPLPLEPDNYVLGALSPAGNRFVVQVGANRELWVYDLRRGTFESLTSDRVVAFSAPTWTRDGRRIIFTTWFDGQVGLGSVAADGSGSVEMLVSGMGLRSYERTHPTLLPDGSGAIMTGLAPEASVEDLLLVRFSGASRLETLLQAPGVERNPAIDPTGRLVAYNLDESGRPEVYVRPYPHLGSRRWQISTAGGGQPRWTRGGRELVYQDGEGRVMSVTVRFDPKGGVDFSKPVPLFTFGSGMQAGFDRKYDVSSDGERFLFFDTPVAGDRTSSVELVWVQNWPDELRRLVPSDP